MLNCNGGAFLLFSSLKRRFAKERPMASRTSSRGAPRARCRPTDTHWQTRSLRRMPVHVQILATCAAGTPGEAGAPVDCAAPSRCARRKGSRRAAPPPSWPQGGASASVPLSEHAAPRMPAAHQRRRTACMGQQHIGVHVRAPGDPGYPLAAAPQHIRRPKLATSIVRYQEARG